MILPIVAYGDPILKQRAKEISSSFKDLEILLKNMWETMYAANGVGLAAPQVGKSLRLFIVDGSPFSVEASLTEDEKNELKGFKKVFINPKILQKSDDLENFNEGCLSIPEVRGDVTRPTTIKIKYQNQYFKEITEHISGLPSRIVQHEYDHLEGILFTDKLSALKKKLLKNKLLKISRGNINVDYLMKFDNNRYTK
ncbi:MAG: peptide deformylase [Bacteroidota bacterium]|nr:peptide deformylase [Bacteroidota bacterium]MEC8098006.1 peptide deformylase [Bacteroidota bacterium]|tara:strand:- start:14199 stop:14789 length:591 start_codon:yes stop_codon:yes gene_type:complete